MARRIVYWAKEYEVNPRDLQPVMRRAIMIVDAAYAVYNKRLTITCTGGKNHTAGSLHPFGFAFDTRTRHLSPTERRKILERIQRDFKGTGYEAFFHVDHFHIEYDPDDWKDSLLILK